MHTTRSLRNVSDSQCCYFGPSQARMRIMRGSMKLPEGQFRSHLRGIFIYTSRIKELRHTVIVDLITHNVEGEETLAGPTGFTLLLT